MSILPEDVQPARSTICLNTIVRNEAHVINRLLASVRPFIDYWVIVDTGSTDGTQAQLRAFTGEVPGELHEEPWRDFAFNRNQALALAAGKGDYLLILDADEVLMPGAGFVLPKLEADLYRCERRRGRQAYNLPLLVRNDTKWSWRGVVHEYLVSGTQPESRTLRGVWIKSEREGARARDQLIFKRDALLLEAALLDEPGNARYAFHLAQSYRDCRDFDLAIRWYEKRLAMGGWDEELFLAELELARCKTYRSDPWGEQLAAYLAAFERLPSRAEPLYWIGRHYLEEKAFETGYLFLERARRCPVPADALAFDRSIYEWRVPLNLAVCALYTNRPAEAFGLNNELLATQDLPEKTRARVIKNQDIVLRQLADTSLSTLSAGT